MANREQKPNMDMNAHFKKFHSSPTSQPMQSTIDQCAKGDQVSAHKIHYVNLAGFFEAMFDRLKVVKREISGARGDIPGASIARAVSHYKNWSFWAGIAMYEIKSQFDRMPEVVEVGYRCLPLPPTFGAGGSDGEWGAYNPSVLNVKFKKGRDYAGI